MGKMEEVRQVLESVKQAGITLRVEDSHLRYTCKKGVLTESLRKALSRYKQQIIELLSEPGWAEEFAAAETLLLRGFRRHGTETARGRVLSTFRDLAHHWHAAHDPRLLEVVPALRALLKRWAEEDARIPREVIGGTTRGEG